MTTRNYERAYHPDVIPIFYMKYRELWFLNMNKCNRYNFELLIDYLRFIETFPCGADRDRVVNMKFPYTDEFIRRFRGDMLYPDTRPWSMPEDYNRIPEVLMKRDKTWGILNCNSENYIIRIYANMIIDGRYIII